MLRLVTAGLFVGTAMAATVNGAEAATDTNATAVRLEQMISKMAEGQEDVPSAPTPKFVNAEQEVVILEEDAAVPIAHGRSLAECRCGAYMNGAVPGEPACFKKVIGNRLCYPRQNGICPDMSMTACTDGGPQASPNADPSVVEGQSFTYLNARFELAIPAYVPMQQLPSAAQFGDALAAFTSTKASRVNVVTSTSSTDLAMRNAANAIVQSASAGRRMTDGPGGSNSMVMFATFASKTTNKRDALNAQLQLMEELPEISGRTYVVNHLVITEQSEVPLVCSAQAEALKSEAKALLEQLVQLQQDALALMKESLEIASANCDGPTMFAIENALGANNGGAAQGP